MNRPRTASLKWWPIYSAGLLACAAITLAAWLLAIGPSLGQLYQRAQRLGELSELRHKSAKLGASFAQLRREHAATAGAIAQLGLRLDPPGSANARLAAITKLANSCGLTVDEVRPGQTLGFPHYQSVALTLLGTGSYPAIARLLHRMHQDARDVALESMDLTTENGNTASSTVRFHLDFVWYAAPAPTAPDAGSPNANPLASGGY